LQTTKLTSLAEKTLNSRFLLTIIICSRLENTARPAFLLLRCSLY